MGDLKKGKYVYYRCSGYEGRCPEPYASQEVPEADFAEMIKGLNFDEETLDWLRVVLRESHHDEKRLHDEAVARLQAQQARLQNRLEGRALTVSYGKPFSLIASAASAAKTIAASAGAETAKSEVWYPLRDSNPCFRRERAAS